MRAAAAPVPFWSPEVGGPYVRNVLLLSMLTCSEHMPAVAIRMPNGALASLAGNIDRHHRVAIADLILVQASVRPTIERLVRELEPTPKSGCR